MQIAFTIRVYLSTEDEKFAEQLFEKYPGDYVNAAFLAFLKEKKTQRLQYSYSLDRLTEEDKRWLVNWIETTIESDMEAEIAAAEAEAAEAEAEAAFLAEMEAAAEAEAYYEPPDY